MWIWGTLALIITAIAALWLYLLNESLQFFRNMTRTTRPGQADEVPELDHGALQATTLELEALGFEYLGDMIAETIPRQGYKAPGGVNTYNRAIGRVMAHRAHGCFGIVLAGYTFSTSSSENDRIISAKIEPFRTAIASFTGTDVGYWTYSTFNSEGQPIDALIRHPRWLGRRLVGATGHELLDVHLSERDTIALQAGITWDLQPSLSKYCAMQDVVTEHIREMRARTTLVKAATLILGSRWNKRDRWMGELENSKA